MSEHDFQVEQDRVIAEGGGFQRPTDPIGVPRGYLGPGAVRPQTGDPRFTAGGLGGFSRELVQQPYTQIGSLEIHGWEEAEVKSLQRVFQLLGPPFGFSARQRFIPGVADPPTTTAWRRLLGFANEKGLSWREAIQKLYDVGLREGVLGGGGAGGRRRAPLVVKLSNPDDIKRAAQLVAQKTVGKDLPENVLSGIVTDFHAGERSIQTEAYRKAETGGTIREGPDVSVITEKKAEAAFPLDAFGVRLRQAFEGLKGAIFGGQIGGI